MSNNSLTLKDANQWALVSFTLIGFIVGFGLNEVMSNDVNLGTPKTVVQAPNPTPTPTPAPAPAAVPAAKAVEIDGDHFVGDEDAPVKLFEFTDFQCPFCGRHYTQTYDQIKKEYVDTGKIVYVVKDFPLSFHQNAQKASEAAECAGDQDKYWEMHSVLFSNQTSLDDASLKRFAGQVGVNQATFDDCLDSGKFAQEVKDDMAAGQGSGITGTPGFILVDKDGNASKLSGAQPFASFKAAIDAVL